jgi:hypothetical protein
MMDTNQYQSSPRSCQSYILVAHEHTEARSPIPGHYAAAVTAATYVTGNGHPPAMLVAWLKDPDAPTTFVAAAKRKRKDPLASRIAGILQVLERNGMEEVHHVAEEEKEGGDDLKTE